MQHKVGYKSDLNYMSSLYEQSAVLEKNSINKHFSKVYMIAKNHQFKT